MQQKYNFINKVHYNWLINLRKKYLFDELKEAVDIIYSIKESLTNNPPTWLSSWSKTALKHNDFWILATIIKKEKIMSVKNALINIERNI